MLSRVANSLYWMSRYIERAESIARLVDVNLQLLLDFRSLDDAGLAAHWLPIVQSSGDEELFQRLPPRPTGQRVRDFLFSQTKPPTSFVPSMGQARENARRVRDKVPSELGEELNRLYLFLHSP